MKDWELEQSAAWGNWDNMKKFRNELSHNDNNYKISHIYNHYKSLNESKIIGRILNENTSIVYNKNGIVIIYEDFLIDLYIDETYEFIQVDWKYKNSTMYYGATEKEKRESIKVMLILSKILASIILEFDLPINYEIQSGDSREDSRRKLYNKFLERYGIKRT